MRIIVLGNLNGNMATAVAMANRDGGRFVQISEEESLVNSVYALGAASIGRKENPRKLEILINTILPPAKKVSYFD